MPQPPGEAPVVSLFWGIHGRRRGGERLILVLAEFAGDFRPRAGIRRLFGRDRGLAAFGRAEVDSRTVLDHDRAGRRRGNVPPADGADADGRQRRAPGTRNGGGRSLRGGTAGGE